MGDFMWLDWLFIAIVALSVLVAFFRGLLREAVSLAAWVIALLLSLKYASSAGMLFSKFIHDDTIRYGVGLALVFIVVLIIGMVINIIIKKFMAGSGFGVLDRSLGALFGLIRGILVVAAIIVVLNMSFVEDNSITSKSVITHQMHPIINLIMSYVPPIDTIKKHTDGYLPQDKDTDTGEG